MKRALFPSLVHPIVLGALVALGLLPVAAPVLCVRLAWLLATNPITLK
jgi:hypothetical protein